MAKSRPASPCCGGSKVENTGLGMFNFCRLLVEFGFRKVEFFFFRDIICRTKAFGRQKEGCQLGGLFFVVFVGA